MAGLGQCASLHTLNITGWTGVTNLDGLKSNVKCAGFIHEEVDHEEDEEEDGHGEDEEEEEQEEDAEDSDDDVTA